MVRIAIIGTGGREQAISWKLVKEGAGVELFPWKDLSLSRLKGYDLVIIGPEEPIVEGIGERIEREIGVKVIAPSKDVIFLEASKIEAKRFMVRHNIPTADFKILRDTKIEIKHFPVVIKADGLCGGKGSFICNSYKELQQALLIIDRICKRGRGYLIEEYLKGKECSVFAYVDGERFEVIGYARDYKRLLDGDKGPNTGGMGAIAPCPDLREQDRKEIEEKIIRRTLKGLKEEGKRYKGFLYFGLIRTEEGWKVLEYNIRLGDPETQAIVNSFSGKWLELFEGKLNNGRWWKPVKYCISVALVSHGYPFEPVEAGEIKGIERVKRHCLIFEGNVEKREGKYFGLKGRVLHVVGCAGSPEEAREKVYQCIEKLEFEKISYRKDIGI